jgi:hypothetical protein
MCLARYRDGPLLGSGLVMSGLCMSGLCMSGLCMSGLVMTGLGMYSRSNEPPLWGGGTGAPGMLSQRDGGLAVFVFE